VDTSALYRAQTIAEIDIVKKGGFPGRLQMSEIG
jgi:hypothetical protein